jgi:hypothetical protein
MSDATDRLYGLPLDEFVPERTALAKRLRADGKRDEATEVGKLAKPSVAAWAVNQVVRSQAAAARALWQAADDLAAAQSKLIAGKGERADLQDPLARMRAALGDLTGAARGLLDGQGRDLSDTTIQRVGETLMAAAMDPDVREAVAAGRATREAAPAGFGLGEGPAPKGPVKRKKAASAKDEEKARRQAEKEAAAAARKAERERVAAARKAAKAELAEARQARKAAEQALEEARAREQRAAKALEDVG